MIELFLADFIDIVTKSGTPKATKVAQVKRRPDYQPAFDFYKHLREGIVDIHTHGHTKRQLGFLMSTVTDPKKQANYPDLVEGYKRWWGRKTLQWFDPPREAYVQNGVKVLVNPELGLEINGVRYVIKMYFKAEQLTKVRIDLIGEILITALAARLTQPTTFAVLDVRNARLFQSVASNPMTLAMVDAELAYVAALWPRV